MCVFHFPHISAWTSHISVLSGHAHVALATLWDPQVQLLIGVEFGDPQKYPLPRVLGLSLSESASAQMIFWQGVDKCLEPWISVTSNVLALSSSSRADVLKVKEMALHSPPAEVYVLSLIGFKYLMYSTHCRQPIYFIYLYVILHTGAISHGYMHASINNTAPWPFVYPWIQLCLVKLPL